MWNWVFELSLRRLGRLAQVRKLSTSKWIEEGGGKAARHFAIPFEYGDSVKVLVLTSDELKGAMARGEMYRDKVTSLLSDVDILTILEEDSVSS